MGNVVATDKQRISVYLDRDLKPLADKLAKARKRSLSNLCEYLLQVEVEKALLEGIISEND